MMHEVVRMASPDFSSPMIALRRSGSEPFRDGERLLPFDVLDFWRWSTSDLVSNVTRGRLAEFLVAQAMGIAGGVRTDWQSYDLKTKHGTTLEVKSAAYLQAWEQQRLSAISFDIAPTRFIDGGLLVDQEPRRQAEIYVFALLHHEEKTSLDPLDLSQWTFIVVATKVLNERFRDQKQLGLSVLRRLDEARSCEWERLGEAVESLEGRWTAMPLDAPRLDPSLFIVTCLNDEGICERSFRVVRAADRRAVAETMRVNAWFWKEFLDRSRLWEWLRAEQRTADEVLQKIDASSLDGDSRYQLAIREITQIEEIPATRA